MKCFLTILYELVLNSLFQVTVGKQEDRFARKQIMISFTTRANSASVSILPIVEELLITSRLPKKLDDIGTTYSHSLASHGVCGFSACTKEINDETIQFCQLL